MNNEEKILEILVSMQKDIRQIDHRLESLETRMGSLETRMDSLETRMESVETRMGSLEKRLTVVEGKLDDLIEAHAETRESVNILIDWAVKASAALNFPLPQIL